MNQITSLFPQSYESSRARFHDDLALVQQFWPQAELLEHKLPGAEELRIEWIAADALAENEKLLVFTTGEHGIEGYLGSAMMQRFIDCYLPRIDPQTTGLLLVHAIDPWGMKYKRRTNAGNVDLNRNFVWQPELIDQEFNLELRKIDKFVDPPRPVKGIRRTIRLSSGGGGQPR